MLMQIISFQWIELAVNQMSEDIVLGLDGFIVKLFHNCWNLIKHEVHEVVEESH